MKTFITFLLGVMLATAGTLWAQSAGFYQDEQGRLGQYYTGPGGQTDYITPDGQRGTLYQMPPLWGKQPC